MRRDFGKASVRGRLVASTNWGINRKGIWMWEPLAICFGTGLLVIGFLIVDGGDSVSEPESR
jgi:hypothetical protein